MPAFLGAVLALFSIELALYHLAPGLLARLAWIPLGKPVRIVLAEAERAALVALGEGEVGYRERLRERLALERMRDQPLRGRAYLAWIRPKAREIVARTRTSANSPGLGLMRVRLRVEGDSIVAASRQYPVPMAAWLFGVWALGQRNPIPVMLLLPVLALVVVVSPRATLRRARDAALEHLRAQIAGSVTR